MVIKQKIAQCGTFLSVSSRAQLNLVVCTKDMHFSLHFSSSGEKRSLRETRGTPLKRLREEALCQGELYHLSSYFRKHHHIQQSDIPSPPYTLVRKVSKVSDDMRMIFVMVPVTNGRQWLQ